MGFNYVARDPLGRLRRGELASASRELATQDLRREGLDVVTLEESGGGGPRLNFSLRRYKKSSIVAITNQLAVMIETGVTLSTAIEGIAAQEESPRLKEVLLELKARVEAGEAFSSALARHPKCFDNTYVALVRAAEETGLLSEMLEQIAEYMQKEMETRGKVRAAMTYPGVMAVLATAVTIFLLTWVMPKFEPIFSRKGVELPTVTLVLMGLSEVLIGYWWAWLAAAIALVAGFVFGRRTEQGRKWLDMAKINLPLLGPIFRKVTLSRNVRTLGTMVGSGVQMLDAIRLTGEVSGNVHYRAAWMTVLDGVTSGNRIVELLAGNALFPATLLQMIASGEEKGKLDIVLRKVSEHYDREIETSLKTATSLIEPALIIVMGTIVGTIGLGLLLPIFTLSKHV